MRPAFLVSLAMSCLPEPPVPLGGDRGNPNLSTSEDSGVDTATTDTGAKKKTECDPQAVPVVIAAVSVACTSTNGPVMFSMTTEGDASDGLVFIQETGNAPPHYAEEHSLEVTSSDPCGLRLRWSAASRLRCLSKISSPIFPRSFHATPILILILKL